MKAKSQTKSRRFAEIILLSITIIWGGTFSVVKIGLSDISPIAFISIRFWIASMVFFLIFRKKLINTPAPVLLRGCFLGLLLFAGFAGQTMGLAETTASKSGFLTGTLVIFTPLAQLAFERKPPTAGNIVGIVLVSIGLWIFTSPQGSGFTMGDWLTLAAAVVWGIYIVGLDIFTKEHDITQLTFLQLCVTAVVSTMVIPLVETPFIHLTANLAGAFAYTAILATVVTTYAQTRYQKATTPTRAAIIFSAEPIVAAAMAYFFLQESIGSAGILGGGLIILGLLISELSDSIRDVLYKIFGIPAKETKL